MPLAQLRARSALKLAAAFSVLVVLAAAVYALYSWNRNYFPPASYHFYIHDPELTLPQNRVWYSDEQRQMHADTGRMWTRWRSPYGVLFAFNHYVPEIGFDDFFDVRRLIGGALDDVYADAVSAYHIDQRHDLGRFNIRFVNTIPYGAYTVRSIDAEVYINISTGMIIEVRMLSEAVVENDFVRNRIYRLNPIMGIQDAELEYHHHTLDILFANIAMRRLQQDNIWSDPRVLRIFFGLTLPDYNSVLRQQVEVDRHQKQMFYNIIGHEFCHHIMNHFEYLRGHSGSENIQEIRRRIEFEADECLARLVIDRVSREQDFGAARLAIAMFVYQNFVDYIPLGDGAHITHPNSAGRFAAFRSAMVSEGQARLSEEDFDRLEAALSVVALVDENTFLAFERVSEGLADEFQIGRWPDCPFSERRLDFFRRHC